MKPWILDLDASGIVNIYHLSAPLNCPIIKIRPKVFLKKKIFYHYQKLFMNLNKKDVYKGQSGGMGGNLIFVSHRKLLRNVIFIAHTDFSSKIDTSGNYF